MDVSLTKIVLHGNLAEATKQKEYEVKVDSFSEALHAVDVLSKREFIKKVALNEKQNIKYKVLVDEENLLSKPLENLDDINNSEIFLKKKMKRIDIVPVLEGAGGGDEKDSLLIVGGALMIGAGISMQSGLLVQLGVFAVLTGLANMMAEPPEFEDFKEIQGVNKKESYLFNGPANTYNPGGPVPLGYGRMMLGSLAIAFEQINYDWMVYKGGTFNPEPDKLFIRDVEAASR
tara:strand:+ start:588 stop:1283 length:696 start_codon:yes stop_codon:yes gene_type:complete